MAKKKSDKPRGMITVMDAPLVRPGFLLCGVADIYKSNWLVTDVWSRVSDRKLIVTMTPEEGGRAVTRELDPDDTITRKIPADTYDKYDQAEREYRASFTE